jgi:hypothetical protein
MTDLNTYITKNYNENIIYFQNFFPEIYQKLSDFESAITNGHYNENYDFVYENDNFDVIDKKENIYLYDKNLTNAIEKTIQTINKELDNNLFSCLENIDINEERITAIKEQRHRGKYTDILLHIQKNSKKQTELKQFDKFIFFGTGLGAHIPEIAQKIKAKSYLIIEDDLELFRLSLFCINYKELSKKSTLFFSVFEDSKEFAETSLKFLDSMFYYNHYIKFIKMPHQSGDKIKEFHRAIVSRPNITFSFDKLMIQYTNPLKILFSGYKTLSNKLRLNNNELNKSNFLLIAPGPSLQKNREWLIKNHKSFILIALSASLSFLEECQISPNIIMHSDSFLWAEKHFTKLKSFHFLKDSLCMFSSATPQSILDMLDKEQIYLFDAQTKYKKSALRFAAPCIGSLTYQMLLLLKAKNVYTLGLDLAIDESTGNTHSATHENMRVLDLENDSNEISYKFSTVSFDGNFKEKVLTTPHFLSSIDAINYSIKSFQDENQLFFNLSNGAKFNKSTPLHTNDINAGVQVSSNIQRELKDLFEKNCLSQEDILDLQEFKVKLKHCKKINKKIHTFSKIKHKSNEDYKNNSIKLIIDICSKNDIQKYELAKIIYAYFYAIMSDIFAYLDMSDVDSYIEINSFLIDRLSMTIQEYENILQDVIKNYKEGK